MVKNRESQHVFFEDDRFSKNSEMGRNRLKIIVSLFRELFFHMHANEDPQSYEEAQRSTVRHERIDEYEVDVTINSQ